MDDLIFGYTWKEIQRAQQGGRLRSAVVHQSDSLDISKDLQLLAEHGEQGLKDMGYAGTLDRLQRAGKL